MLLLGVDEGEQGRACACAVRRHFGLILEDRTFFREKRLTFLRGKIKEFLLRGAIKRAESRKCLAEYKGG